MLHPAHLPPQMDAKTRDRIDALRAAKVARPPLTHAEIAAESPYTYAYIKAVLNGRDLPVHSTDETLDNVEAAIGKARAKQRPVSERHGRGFAVAE